MKKLTRASRWITWGMRPASMTAWTCVLVPAVILDKNQTASYKKRLIKKI